MCQTYFLDWSLETSQGRQVGLIFLHLRNGQGVFWFLAQVGSLGSFDLTLSVLEFLESLGCADIFGGVPDKSLIENYIVKILEIAS